MKEAPKVLLADDDPAVRTLLRRFLETKGYRVAVSASGQEVLQALAVFAPDLLILDVVMEDLGGLELLKRLHDQGSKIPIIMITGDSDLETAQRCLALGASDYILKPINLGYLETSVWTKVTTNLPPS